MARRLLKHTTSYQYPHLRTMCSDPLTSSPFAPTTIANFTMAGWSLLTRAINSASSSPSAIRTFKFATLRSSSREPSFEAIQVLRATTHATSPAFTSHQTHKYMAHHLLNLVEKKGNASW